MPRRRDVPKREILPDPVFQSPLVTRFINNLMSKGKKSIAEATFYGAMDLVKERAKDDPLKLFRKAVDNVKPVLEVKSRRVGGSNYQVPIEVRPERRTALAIRWLIGPKDGAANFALRMFEVQPGGHTPLHVHPHEHEVFIVEGAGAFVCEGTEHPFEAEHAIFVPGGSEHCFKNTGDGVMRFLCIIPADAK